MNHKETQLQCPRCDYKIAIPLYQPVWKVDLQDLSDPPSSCYREYLNFSDLLKINELLGEQNVILKRQLLSLMNSLKYYIEKERKNGMAETE